MEKLLPGWMRQALIHGPCPWSVTLFLPSGKSLVLHFFLSDDFPKTEADLLPVSPGKKSLTIRAVSPIMRVNEQEKTAHLGFVN
jgi:hypothetical protein